MSSPERDLLKRHCNWKLSVEEHLKLLRETEALLAQPEPPMTQREMYQRGYAAAERNLKREPLSDDEIMQTTQGMSEFGAEMFKAGVRAAEKAHGIGSR